MKSIPPGWRLVPSRSRQQQQSTSNSKIIILSYENIYTGERFAQPPTSPAKADLPSELFINHVQKLGEQLIQQQSYQMGCLLRDSKILHEQQQNSSYAVKLEEINKESASLVGSALSGQRLGQTDQNVNEMMRVGESLYSPTYQAELLTYRTSLRQIVKNSISQIEIVHGRQVQLLQNLVQELTLAWHSGCSNAELHESWIADYPKLNLLNHWHTGGKDANKVIKKRSRRLTAFNTSFNSDASNTAVDKNIIVDDWDNMVEPTVIPKNKVDGVWEESIVENESKMKKKSMNYAKPAYDGAIFFEPHSIKVQDQLEITYQAKYQKELIRKVRDEFQSVQKLIKLSRKKRLNVIANADDCFEEILEEEEEDAAENVEYLKKELKLAREKLHFTNSDIKMSKEKLMSIRSSTKELRAAYNSWDGNFRSMLNSPVLAAHTGLDIGYKIKKTKGIPLSHMITLARRNNLATYIATSGDGKRNDDEESKRIHKKLKAARALDISKSKGSKMAQRTGFNSPSMKKLFMLSLAYEAGTEEKSNRTGGILEKVKSLKTEFGGVNEDPKFKRMQTERSKIMMNLLSSNGVPPYVMTKFKVLLDEHAIAISKTTHNHTTQEISELDLSNLVKKLQPIHKSFIQNIKDVANKHALSSAVVNQILSVDQQAINIHLNPALKQIMRVLRSMKRRNSKRSGGIGKKHFSSEKIEEQEQEQEHIDDQKFGYDHRLQRVSRKSTTRLSSILKQHRVRARVASLLKAATQKHYTRVEEAILQQTEENELNDLSSLSSNSVKKTNNSHIANDNLVIALESEKHAKTLQMIQKEHNLSNELIDDINDSHNMHHIHLLNGDSDDDSDSGSNGSTTILDENGLPIIPPGMNEDLEM
jgi:hypothetical protein